MATQLEVIEKALRHGWVRAGRNSRDQYLTRTDKTGRSRHFLHGRRVLALTVLRCGKIFVTY